MKETMDILNKIVEEYGIAAWIAFAVVALLLVSITLASAWHTIKFLIVKLIPGMIKVGGVCAVGLLILGSVYGVFFLVEQPDVKKSLDELYERDAKAIENDVVE